jgi:LPXTG-motif cell wall-anchored protein
MSDQEDAIHKAHREIAQLQAALDQTEEVLAKAEAADDAARRAMTSKFVWAGVGAAVLLLVTLVVFRRRRVD